MAKMQARRVQQQEERGDGLREKMVAVNRVTKVVKGGRVLGFAALFLLHPRLDLRHGFLCNLSLRTSVRRRGPRRPGPSRARET